MKKIYLEICLKMEIRSIICVRFFQLVKLIKLMFKISKSVQLTQVVLFIQMRKVVKHSAVSRGTKVQLISGIWFISVFLGKISSQPMILNITRKQFNCRLRVVKAASLVSGYRKIRWKRATRILFVKNEYKLWPGWEEVKQTEVWVNISWNCFEGGFVTFDIWYFI